MFKPQVAAGLLGNLQPIYVGNGGFAGNGASASTAVSPSYPSNVASGDIAFLVVQSDNTSTLGVPAGWTAAGAMVTAGNLSARVWWQRLNGTETGTVAVTRGSGATGEFFGAVIHSFRNVSTANPPFEGYATPAQSLTTTMNGPAVVTTDAKRLAVLFWCQGDRLASLPGGSYIEQLDDNVNSGGGGEQVCDTQVVPAAATVAAVTRTITAASPSICFGLALLPAFGAVPANPLARNHLNSGIGTTSVVLSITPTPGALLVISAGTRRNTSLPAVLTCAGGTGNTYTDVVAQGAQLGTNGVRAALFKCRLGASPGTFSITVAAASTTSIGACIEEFVNAADDTSNAAMGVYSATGDSVTTLPGNPAADSVVLAHEVAVGASSIIDPPGYANIVELTPTGARMRIGYNATLRSVIDWNSPGAEAFSAAVEIKQAA